MGDLLHIMRNGWERPFVGIVVGM